MDNASRIRGKKAGYLRCAPIGYRFQRARSGKLFQKGGVLLTGYAAGFRVPLRGLF